MADWSPSQKETGKRILLTRLLNCLLFKKTPLTQGQVSVRKNSLEQSSYSFMWNQLQLHYMLHR